MTPEDRQRLEELRERAEAEHWFENKTIRVMRLLPAVRRGEIVPCPECGHPLFFVGPGSPAPDGVWCHPGLYCPAGCTAVMINMEPADHALLRRLEGRGRDPLRDYRKVQEVVAGARAGFNADAAGLLRLLLSDAGGADATVDAEGFQVVFARERHRYEFPPKLAPYLVSELLRWAGTSSLVVRVHATIEPEVTLHPERPPERMDARRLWLEATDAGVRIQLRSLTDDEAPELEIPAALPDGPETAPCPFCGEPLRTPAARQCRFCRKDWHDPEHVRELG